LQQFIHTRMRRERSKGCFKREVVHERLFQWLWVALKGQACDVGAYLIGPATMLLLRMDAAFIPLSVSVTTSRAVGSRILSGITLAWVTSGQFVSLGLVSRLS